MAHSISLAKQLDAIECCFAHYFVSSMQLPEFPSKKMFGSLSPALIKERQAALEKYMKAIAMDETVSRNNVFRTHLIFIARERDHVFCA
jgi:hypothetical protein